MTMRIMRINTALGLAMAVAAFAAIAPSPTLAQQQTGDPRWLPWLGCWQAEDAPADAGLLCVRPLAEQGSVEILRMKDTDVVSREVVWADGQRHETSREGCNGWEKGAFSQDGSRVFLSSSHTCEGGTVREGGGIMSFAAPNEWLDVRYLGMGDSRTPWVQRYRLATDAQAEAAGMGGIAADQGWSVGMARMAAANAPTVDDVIEASAAEPAEAVEAWVAERSAPFTLDSDQLVRMADAGVSERVIDVTVAVSYPRHFNVSSKGPAPDRTAADDRYGNSYGWGYRGYSPYYYDPFYYGYGGYGYGRYGYGYGGYYGGYGYTPVIVISNNSDQPTYQHGRVIAGRGYTRGSTGSTGSSASVPRSSGSSGSSARPSSGSSTPARTAKPRGGGGGGRGH
jgi:hypothetical protein